MAWTINETDLSFADEDVLSTIFTVGNGASCTRGTHGEQRHEAFRGMYVSGLFTRAGYGLMYFMAGPDWLRAVPLAGGKPMRMTGSQRILDLHEGILHREATFGSGKASLALQEERFVSMHIENLCVQRIQVTVRQAGEPVEFVMAVDADTRNHQAKYFQPGQLPNCTPQGLRLTRPAVVEADDGVLRVSLLSPQTGSAIEAAAIIRQTTGPQLDVRYEVVDGEARAVFTIGSGVEAGTSFTFLKMFFYYTGDDGLPCALTDSTVYDEVLELARQATYKQLRDEHAAGWKQFWDAADVEIDGDEAAQLAVRYALWSTRIAAPDDDGESSIGAKNLTGDWYRGAVFWDMEMFQLPMLSAVAPHLAANHILYRASRLDAARTLATQDGYDGARYPWQSYKTGLEEPPVLGGFLYQQVHLNAAVAWGINQYHALTGDNGLLLDHGLEVMIELAKYWASRAVADESGAWHIRRVCGPDEVHKDIDDNAYTNRMTAFVLRQTARLVRQMRDVDAEAVENILATTDVTAAQVQQWVRIADGLAIPALPDGTLAQFAGFEDAPEPDPALNKAGDRHDNTNKQADTLLIFQALPGAFDGDMLARCYRQYAPLCHQTSSLSLCTHALLAIRQGLARDARKYFETTIGIDLGDTAGNTAHGIHGAGEGGIWLAVVHGFGGLTVRRDGTVDVAPRLPAGWQRLRYRFGRHGQPLQVTIDPHTVTIANTGDREASLRLYGSEVTIAPGDAVSRSADNAWQAQGLEAVVFDLDGVLVSTDEFHYMAWKELADELGLAFDKTVNHQLRGVSREESLRRIYAHNKRQPPSEAMFEQQCARKNARYVELIGGMSPEHVLPGAIDLLEALRKAGIRTAVASASKNAPLVLQKTGLDKWLDAIVDGSVVTASKPDPQGFYTAAQRLRVLPWNCVGVEDAESGIEAILRAGMVAVGIGDQTPDAHLQVASVQDLSVETLQRAFLDNDNPVNPYLERNAAKVRNEAKQS